jgi:putative ABC transport system substrate-binding protein
MGGFTRRELIAGGAGLALGALPARAFANRPPPRIYMATFRGWTSADQGFKDYFIRRRLVVELIHRDVERNAARIPDLVTEIEALKPDLVYCWGTTVSLGILGGAPVPGAPPESVPHVTNIPAVFVNVADPVGSGLVADLGPTGRNVTGSVFVAPVRTQLQVLQSYRPATRIGAIYNPLESNAETLVEQLAQEAAQHRIEVVKRPVDVVNGDTIASTLHLIPAELKARGCDWLYMPPDSFLSKHPREVTEAGIELGLPTFAAAEGVLDNGSSALTGVIARYYNIGQLAGYQAERILFQGIKPGEIAIENLSRYSVVVNMAVALRMKLYPPMQLLRVAEII